MLSSFCSSFLSSEYKSCDRARKKCGFHLFWRFCFEREVLTCILYLWIAVLKISLIMLCFSVMLLEYITISLSSSL
jgi:hypothetical protein